MMLHRSRLSRWARIALLILVAAFIVALYWPSTGLPLSFDDAWSMRLVQDFSVVDLFTRTANFGYYRPLYLAYYRVAALAGESGPAVLHVLCITAHVANSLLLLALVPAMVGPGSHDIAVGTAVLFACNPFSVQAVALPAGLNHSFALLLVQLATLAYIRARAVRASRRHAAGWWLACLSASMLAFLSNEIGLSVAGFCLVAEVVRAVRERTWPRAAWSFLFVAALCAVYVALYAVIPKGAAPEFVFSLAGMIQRIWIALHTLAYPLVAIFGLVGVAPALAVSVAIALTLALCVWAARSRPIAMLAGLGLFAAAIALPILRLPTGYIENSPRVFTISAVGTSIAWATIALSLGDVIARRMETVSCQGASGIRVLQSGSEGWMIGGVAGHLASGIVVSLIALLGSAHVAEQIGFYARASEPVRAIAEHGAQIGPEQTLLALNPPEWVAVPSRRFPLFSEGAILLAPYVDGRDLVLANTGLTREVKLASFALPFQPGSGYAFQTFGASFAPLPPASMYYTATRVLQTHYLSDTLRTDWIGGATHSVPQAVEAHFGDGLALVRHHVMPCRDGWVVALQWRRLGPIETRGPTLSAFVQALDTDGAQLSQQDGAPLQGLLPFDQLPADIDMLDRRALIAPGAGEALLSLGLYDYTTGLRLPATDDQGRHLAGDALTVPLPPRDPRAECR
jgi:hypothetical protein